MRKFLIDALPPDAAYVPSDLFVNSTDETTLLNTVQVVDTRPSLADFQDADDSDILHFFEIEDRIDSEKQAECLHSLSIFKMANEISTTGKRFEVYAEGLRRWIAFMEMQDAHKLRVYFGNSAWNALFEMDPGLLSAPHVDYIRMKDSSAYTEIGTFWRFLAFDDYDYEYVWIRETDGTCNLVNGEWEFDDLSFGLARYDEAVSQLNANSTIHFRTEILPFPPSEFRKDSIPINFPLFFWAQDYRLSGPLHIHRLSEYIQSSSPSLMRGPRRLPFAEIVKFFCYFLKRGTERQVYRDGMWTNIRERHPNLNFRYIDEMWLFDLTRVANVFFEFDNEALGIYSEWRAYQEDWFFKRLCDDLRDDGQMFIAPKLSKDQYIFDMSPDAWRWSIQNTVSFLVNRFFLLDMSDMPFGDHWEYAHLNNLIMEAKDEDAYDDFVNNISVIDPRWSASDLQRIQNNVPSTRAREMFEVKDKVESQRQGTALCSICLFDQGEHIWSKAYQPYLDGLKLRIETFRNELPDQTLRVYVGDSAWDSVYSEGILSVSDVDFYRMSHNSEASFIGMNWRLLAFDDYDYEYVYLEDTDPRVDQSTGAPIDELRVNSEILARMFHCGNSDIEPAIVSSLSFSRDLEGNLFYETQAHETYATSAETELNGPRRLCCITNPAHYYRTSILTMARGPRRLPFDNIVPILCEVLFNSPNQFQLIHTNSHRTSYAIDAMPSLTSYELGETWVFYLSKLMPIKMWIEPRHMGWVAQHLKRHGKSSFWRRLHEQMIIDGNYLACGDQGVDRFSFEAFNE